MKYKGWKRVFAIIPIFLLIISFSIPAFASCPEGTSWTAAWTDVYGQTTYSLQAPCFAYVNTPFDIIASVTDAKYPNTSVGGVWYIMDNGATIAGPETLIILDEKGLWQRTVSREYTEGGPVEHSIQFKFKDFGQGGGGMGWVDAIIGGITVGPYRINTPPTVDAGQNLLIAGEDQNITVIPGTASDVDGDALFYRWLEGIVEVQPSQPVDASGNAPLNLAAVPRLSIGAHTFTLEVSDGRATVTDDVIVTVENSAPIAAPSTNGNFLIGQDISLKGSVSDYDGDNVEYAWLEGSTVLVKNTISTTIGGAEVQLPEYIITGGLPLGTHTLTLQVSDGIQTVAAPTTVTVIDTSAPTMAPTASSNILWPPNGEMRTVTITANASDNSGGPVMLSVLVTSNERPKTDKDGNEIPDISNINIDQATGTITLQLRGSRLGNGGDRLYYIDITAVDASGNSSTSRVVIRAPHDMGRN